MIKKIYKAVKGAINNYFIAGLLTVVPLYISGYVVFLILRNGDRIFNVLPQELNPHNYLPFHIPGLGVVVVLLGILMVGLLVRNYVGGKIVDLGERVLYSIPLIRPLYSAVKQLLAAIFSQSSRSFQRVALIQFPRKGIYAVCFVTAFPNKGIMKRIGDVSDDMIGVFLPTTPNPTTGFYLVVSESEIIPVDLKVEEAFKIIVSGGLASSETDLFNHCTLLNSKKT